LKSNPLNYDFIFNKELFDTNINKNNKELNEYIYDELEDKDKKIIDNSNKINNHCKNFKEF